ncbi:TIGR03089 family protein [Corynebacterium sp. CNCTC7651]|uniref:TIGR03089 family protein n=1 Tax=Corynebacterium sp. CNCTC7651 TaxID=2815361 RepID=UPI001F20C21E|nr:TIGR03089 family protein [Corynebacterium sp. CNCTC7651]UIZ92610.1 TIGR03089 family protein [Corynebacterium sp. CNCTC7651]
MNMLSPLIASDPASPRLTVYDEARDTRMEFSALTLDNWACKVANMLDEEFELEPDATVLIDLPASWQAAVIALGTYASGRRPAFGGTLLADVVFTSPERFELWADVPDCAVVSADPFGRGVVESGGELPLGAVDFGPTVRFYGDQYLGASPELAQWMRDGIDAARYLIPAWEDAEQFEEYVLAPLAAGGSVVLASGLMSAERREQIMASEKVTSVLTAR